MSSCHRCMSRDIPTEYPDQANEQSIYQAAMFAKIRKNRRKAMAKLAVVAFCDGLVVVVLRALIFALYPVLWVLGKRQHTKNLRGE